MFRTAARHLHGTAGTSAAAAGAAVPSPRGLPLVGTTLALLAAGSTPKLHKYIDRRHRELGPIFREDIGPVACVFISDPDEMRNVFAREGKYPVHVLPEAWTLYNEMYGCSRGLFFMDGEEWLHFRRIMNKLLLKGDLGWIDRCCEVVGNKTVDKIKYNNVEGQPYRSLPGDLYKWSLDVLVCILLGETCYNKNNKQVEKMVRHLGETVHLVFETSAKLALIPAKLAATYKIPAWRRFEDSVDQALTSASHLVEYMLEQFPEGDGLLHRMQEEQMNTSELIRIVADLILAAGDTTAYSMQWILYLLSKNPQVQDELRQKLLEGTAAQLKKDIVRESLRLYPVAPFLTRFLPEATQIAGYEISAGTLMIMSIYTSGRDAKYFRHPERFDPNRWTRTSSNYTTKASLPFAIGSRSCVGRRIAETQLRDTTAKIVSNFRMELCNKRDVDMVLKMVCVPSEPLLIKFTPID